MFSKSISSVLVSTLFAAGAASAAASAPLTLEVFNPGEAAIFPVASVLVAGKHDAVLIDAQFSRAEAQKLVEKIRASGKKLTTVYISHSDPDFYFGLDVIKAAFPQAKIVATPETVAEIRRKADAKVAYWGPILKDNAPHSIVIPEALKGQRISLEGQSLTIAGADAIAHLCVDSIDQGRRRRRGAVWQSARVDGRYAKPAIAPGLAQDTRWHRRAETCHRRAGPLQGRFAA